MPKDWQDLVTQALLMYDDVDDIKRALRGRFGSGKHGNVTEWYEYPEWLNERREKDRLFKDWSNVWQQAKGLGIELCAIPYDTNDEEIKIKLEKLKERIGV